MIILVFLTPFVIAIIWLVMIDSSNTEQIEKFLKSKECKEVVYYKSKYQAICKDEIILVKNQFNIDFKSNEVINYKDIDSITNNEKTLKISSKQKEFILEFENDKDTKKYFLNIKGKQINE